MKRHVCCAPLLLAACLLGGCAESAPPEESVALFSGTDRKELYQAVYSALTKYQDHVQVVGDPNNFTLTEICQQIRMEHPEIFWFNGWYSTATDSEHPTVYYISFNTPTELTAQQCSDMQKDLTDAAAEICAQIPADADDYEKALFVHDYLIANTVYTGEGDNAGNAYGCIMNHAAYCEGYSRAFLLLMQQLGIPAGYVSGTDVNGGNHMWNYLELGGEYYWADVTWDDTSVEGTDEEQLNHYYCFLNDEIMLKTHHVNITEPFIPTCSSMEMNYFEKNGWRLESYDCDALCGIIADQLRNGKEPIEIMFDSQKSYDTANSDLFDNNRFWQLENLPDDLDYVTCSCCETPAVLRIDIAHKDAADAPEPEGEAAQTPAEEPSA